MADEGKLQTSRLDGSRNPIAIVHEGFFVYANEAFLERTGYKTLADLEAVPLLDLVAAHDHQRLREHLDRAKKSAGTDTHQAEARLTLLRADELPLTTDCTSFRTRFGGEDCVQLTLKSRRPESVGQAIRELPWRQYLSIAFLALFTVLPSLLLLRLNIDNAPSVYFPDDEPAVVADRALRERFPSDQVFFLVFEGVALFSDGFLQAYDELSRALLRLPSVDDVISITQLDHISSSDDGFVIDRLIDVNDLDESHPRTRGGQIADDRFAQEMLISRDGQSLGMIVIPEDSRNSIERLKLDNALNDAIRSAGLDGYLVAKAGWIPVDVAELRSMLRDNAIFIPATVLIGLFLIWLLFRRRIAVVMAGIAVGVVINSTVAFYVVFDQPFSLISSLIPPLLSALTVAALVHLFNALYHASQRGYGGAERVRRALHEVDRPALFAALTTAAGLASLGTSPIVPIKTFGLISALGVGLIYVVVYRILPNLLARWDRAPWPRVTGGLRTMDAVVKALVHTGIRHPGIVLVVTSGLLALGAPQLSKITVETNFQQFFATDHEIRQATDYVDGKFVGTMPIEVVFNATGRDGLATAEALRAMRTFQDWVETLPEVDRAFSMADIVEDLHWAFRGEDPAFRVIPDDDQLIGQLLLVYDGDDLYDLVDRDFQHSHITLNLNVHSANAIDAVMTRINAYLEGEVGDRFEWEVAGAGRLFADMEELLVAGQVYSLVGALILIFVFMLVLWRAPWGAVLCMLPNLSPILLIFIVMGAAGIWLDMATAMIASVAVGIAVDDTIHVYHGFQHRLRLGASPVVALMRSYREAGRAVVVTTLILSAQFLILVTSDFLPSSNFGLLTTIGLFAAMVFDLLLLPALLIVFHGDHSPVAALLARLRGRRPTQIAEEFDESDPTVDSEYWTPDRRVALVKEILASRLTTKSAVHEYKLPEEEIDRWVKRAMLGIDEAFGKRRKSARRDPAKVRALARAYKKLKEENRSLKARIDS